MSNKENSLKEQQDEHFEYIPMYARALDQAVNFLSSLISKVERADVELDFAINGKNDVKRGVALADAVKTIARLRKDTKDWRAVIDTMKKGKDVHIQENCKSNKLEIVSGFEADFGQYLINQSNGKWCERNPRGNVNGKTYMERIHDK